MEFNFLLSFEECEFTGEHQTDSSGMISKLPSPSPWQTGLEGARSCSRFQYIECLWFALLVLVAFEPILKICFGRSNMKFNVGCCGEVVLLAKVS